MYETAFPTSTHRSLSERFQNLHFKALLCRGEGDKSVLCLLLTGHLLTTCSITQGKQKDCLKFGVVRFAMTGTTQMCLALPACFWLQQSMGTALSTAHRKQYVPYTFGFLTTHLWPKATSIGRFAIDSTSGIRASLLLKCQPAVSAVFSVQPV